MIRSFFSRGIHCRWRMLMGVFLLIQTLPLSADEDGRYRAIVLHEGGRSGQSGTLMPKVFIIDSREGDMWIWEQKTKLQDSKGNFALGTVLTYQGRVRPGKKMGDVVEQVVGK